jgi:hypothetical protein
MKYSLVLQFRSDSLLDYDTMNQLQDTLMGPRGGSVTDFHYIGADKRNISVFTNDPVATFERAKPVLSKMNSLENVTAAYCRADADDYTVLWPKGSTAEFKID